MSTERREHGALFGCALTVALFLGGCAVPPPVSVHAVDVRLVAQDRSWKASYLVADPSGRTSEVSTGREVHIPVGAGVRLRLTSRDYVSDFTIDALGLRDFTTPSMPADLYFVADRPGRYELRGDELCGLPHTDLTRGWLVVEDSAAFLSWMQRVRKEHV